MAVEWKHSHSREQVKNTVRSSRKSSAVPLLTLYTHTHIQTQNTTTDDMHLKHDTSLLTTVSTIDYLE